MKEMRASVTKKRSNAKVKGRHMTQTERGRQSDRQTWRVIEAETDSQTSRQKHLEREIRVKRHLALATSSIVDVQESEADREQERKGG